MTALLNMVLPQLIADGKAVHLRNELLLYGCTLARAVLPDILMPAAVLACFLNMLGKMRDFSCYAACNCRTLRR